MAELRPKMVSIRPTRAGIARLSTYAQRWGVGFFYYDGLRVALSSVDRIEMADLLILRTDGHVIASEIQELLEAEIP